MQAENIEEEDGNQWQQQQASNDQASDDDSNKEISDTSRISPTCLHPVTPEKKYSQRRVILKDYQSSVYSCECTGVKIRGTPREYRGSGSINSGTNAGSGAVTVYSRGSGTKSCSRTSVQNSFV